MVQPGILYSGEVHVRYSLTYCPQVRCVSNKFRDMDTTYVCTYIRMYIHMYHVQERIARLSSIYYLFFIKTTIKYTLEVMITSCLSEDRTLWTDKLYRYKSSGLICLRHYHSLN